MKGDNTTACPPADEDMHNSKGIAAVLYRRVVGGLSFVATKVVERPSVVTTVLVVVLCVVGIVVLVCKVC